MEYITGCYDTEKILVENLNVKGIIGLCLTTKKFGVNIATIPFVVDLKYCFVKSGGLSKYQKELINTVCELNYFNLLDWLFDHDDSLTYNSNAFDAAVAHGHCDTVKWWLNSTRVIHNSKTIYETQHLDILGLMHFRDNHHKIIRHKHYAMSIAAANGRLDIMKWHFYNGLLYCSEFLSKSIVAASKYGHVDILVWLHYTFRATFQSDFDALNAAYEHRHVNVLEWWQLHATRQNHTLYAGELLSKLKIEK